MQIYFCHNCGTAYPTGEREKPPTECYSCREDSEIGTVEELIDKYNALKVEVRQLKEELGEEEAIKDLYLEIDGFS